MGPEQVQSLRVRVASTGEEVRREIRHLGQLLLVPEVIAKKKCKIQDGHQEQLGIFRINIILAS